MPRQSRRRKSKGHFSFVYSNSTSGMAREGAWQRRLSTPHESVEQLLPLLLL